MGLLALCSTFSSHRSYLKELTLLPSVPCYLSLWGFPTWLSGKEPTCQCRRCRFGPWVGKIPWRRKWTTHSSILAMDRRTWRASVYGVSKSLTCLSVHIVTFNLYHQNRTYGGRMVKGPLSGRGTVNELPFSWGQGGVRNIRLEWEQLLHPPSAKEPMQILGIRHLKAQQSTGRKGHLSCGMLPGDGTIPF